MTGPILFFVFVLWWQTRLGLSRVLDALVEEMKKQQRQQDPSLLLLVLTSWDMVVGQGLYDHGTAIKDMFANDKWAQRGVHQVMKPMVMKSHQQLWKKIQNKYGKTFMAQLVG